jgi:DnaJ-class molecular chaperone
MDTDEIVALVFLDAGQQAAADEVAEVRTAPYECPRCHGDGYVMEGPNEVTCSECDGDGYVDDEILETVEMPVFAEEENS